jgi:hypothetical protein
MPWPPAPVPVKRPISGVDLTISIIALVFTLLIGGSAAVMGFFMLAFLDHCPPETCSAESAVTAVGISLIVAVVVGLAGLVVTVVQLARRRPAWPFALGTLVLCGVICAFGFVGYIAAVGAGQV